LSEGAGKGSTFTLRLPLLAGNRPAAPAPEAAHAGPVHADPSTVLLIEDNDDARSMLSAQLSSAGYRVLEASNGIEGIAIARSARPALSIVDIGLPGMDGYQVAAHLRADPAMRAMRLVALTGYGQESDRQRALDAGFDRHFVKPLKFEELARSLASS
jgi:CheY-like chemotaxis protein